MDIQRFISDVNPRAFTNNAQRLAFRLLKAEGEWVGINHLKRTVPSGDVRPRELRRPQYGAFQVDCKSAPALSKKGGARDFFYRINPRRVTKRQLSGLFG